MVGGDTGPRHGVRRIAAIFHGRYDAALFLGLVL